MQNPRWRGIFPAITTKFHADESLDAEGTARHIDFQIRNGIHGLVTCGSLGEASTLTLEEKLAGQKQIKALEAQRNQKRRSLFDAQDQVDKQREELIAVIEGKLNQATTLQPLFMLRWNLN